MISIHQRRSARLAAKPKKSYKMEDTYDSESESESIPDAGQIDDINDSDYKGSPQKWSEETEKLYIMPLFREKLKKYNPTEEELNNIVQIFEKWFDVNKDDQTIYDYYSTDNIGCWEHTFDTTCQNCKIIGKTRRTMCSIVNDYINRNKHVYERRGIDIPSKSFDNNVLLEVIFMVEFRTNLKRELEKIGLEYDERLFTGFLKWYNNPANKDKLYFSHRWSPDTLHYKQKATIVKMYIKTIPKKIIF